MLEVFGNIRTAESDASAVVGEEYQVIDYVKSGLCAQTRASSLAGGMPVW